GGPALSRLAQAGDPQAHALPRPMLHGKTLDFSFSGLKTAVLTRLQALEKQGLADDPTARADLAAATEAAIVDVLAGKALQALSQTGLQTLVVAGGVGANGPLRARLQQAMVRRGGQVFFPPVALCTDNGAMIAWAAVLRARAGLVDWAALRDDTGFDVHPRWDLQDVCVR
ncbi:MAG: tRNA (adenosine(37)-N6)-threonylcarbamoyltransferase complex transferase subunit TsaD, partial [Castellaniella sp.]